MKASRLRHVYRGVLAAVALGAALVLLPAAHAETSAVPSTPNVLLYVTNSASSLKSLRAHVNSMDIIAPQTYAATPSGKLLGKPSAEVLLLARNAGARVMPLVVNQDFSQSGMHALLLNDQAQNELIAAMITEAKLQGYIGFQYDFEHMMASDRDLYSKFVAKSAPYFHGAGLQLSVAMSPQHSANVADYGEGSWQNWTGAFDYAAIGQAADFVSIMAYDDSRSLGPVASMPWVEEVLAFSLERIPAHKISLGIPFYTWVWDNKTGKRVDIRSYKAVADLLKTKQVIKKSWSTALGVAFVTYKKAGKTYTAWYEDERSFQQKLELVSDSKLFGFSAWALGLEDPRIWDAVVAMRAPRDGLAMR